jgi:hypothetical protein
MKPAPLSHVIDTSLYWSNLTVIRWRFIAVVLVIFGLSLWLRGEYGHDDSNLWLVMNLFLRIVVWTIAGLFTLSLLSVLATWLFFLNRLGNGAVSIQARFGDGIKADAGWVPLTFSLSGPVWRPLLGTIQARLIFTEKKISDRIILDTNMRKPRHWWRYAIRGSGQTLLHDRGIYDVEKVLILFCDMFGLVALPKTVSQASQLYTLPLPLEPVRAKTQPHATEDQKHRTDIPRRVEGDYLHYKEFGAGDNPQRIVWKIYAKSGQLVVRVPEIRDPYASHLYFYASFFNGITSGGGAFEKELLNVYKDQVRNLWEALQRNGYDVRLPHDQEVPRLPGVNEAKNELFQITAAVWQSQTAPTKFINFTKAAFVCLSSLTPFEEVEGILKNLPPSVPVVVVTLSDAIASPFRFALGNIFFRPIQQPADHLRQPWLLSSLRRTLKENEYRIATAIRARGNGWLTNDIPTTP